MLVRDDKKRTIGLLLGALAFVLRPTSAITWGFLGLYHILNLKSFSEFMKFVFKCAAPVGYDIIQCSIFCSHIDSQN